MHFVPFAGSLWHKDRLRQQLLGTDLGIRVEQSALKSFIVMIVLFSTDETQKTDDWHQYCFYPNLGPMVPVGWRGLGGIHLDNEQSWIWKGKELE